jgi:hypothetical protein
MALALLGVLLLAAFIWLSEAAREGSTEARVAAAVVALGVGAAATLGLLIAMFIDSEFEGDHTALVLAATFGWVCILAALANTLYKRDRSAIVWMLAAAVCFAVWTAYMAPLGDRFGI